MPGPRLVEAYSVAYARNAVKDSLSYLGEQCILLNTYHVIPDAGTQPRCSCFSDIYEGSDNFNCPGCYGTTFEGGIKTAVRAWAQFSDAIAVEQIERQGMWNPDKRQIQTEWQPILMHRDFVVRVSAWANNIPQTVAGIYRIGQVANDSLRSGQRYGQTSEDIIGQKATLEDLPTSYAIYKYPVVGQSFSRWDGRVF